MPQTEYFHTLIPPLAKNPGEDFLNETFWTRRSAIEMLEPNPRLMHAAWGQREPEG